MPRHQRVALLSALVITTFVQAANMPAQAPVPRSGPAEQGALDALNRFRPPIQFGVYAARSADDLTVAVEVPPEATAAGRWREGANLMALAEDADGQGVGSAEGRLVAGRALMRIRLEPGASVRNVAVRLHTDVDALLEGAPVAPLTLLVGDPLVYRTSTHAPDGPIAILSFSHRDAIRLEWPVLAPLAACAARLLDGAGRPMNALRLDRTEARVVRLDWKIPRLHAGDYLIELTVSGSTGGERKLLAIRIR